MFNTVFKETNRDIIQAERQIDKHMFRIGRHVESNLTFQGALKGNWFKFKK